MQRGVRNEGLDKALFDTIVGLNRGCLFHNMLKITLTALGPGRAVMETPIGENHINPQNVAHGGVAFSLADTAMGMSIRTYDRFGVTIDMCINYLKSAKLGDILTATGRVVHLGEKIIVVEADVVNQKNELVAVTRGTYINMGRVTNSSESQ